MLIQRFLIFILLTCCFYCTSTLAQSQSKKEFTIGVFATPPLSFVNKNGNPDGFIVDLLNEIANKENIKIKWLFDDWTDHFNRMKNKRLDMITSVGYTDERAQFLNYSSSSYVTVWGQVFLPGNSDIETILDLNNKTIGILKDGVNGQRFKEQCSQFDVKCNIVEFEDYEDMFREVSSGTIDAGVSNNLVGESLIKSYNVISSSIVFNPFKVYVAIPKNNPSTLLEIFDRYMDEWKQDPSSFYYQTRLKWIKPVEDAKLPKTFYYLLISIASFAIFTLLLAFLFKKQVQKRVNELSGREQQLNQIINLVPHMIYVADTHGNIVLANKHASDFFGKSNSQFEVSNVTELLDENNNYFSLLDDSVVLRKSGSGPTHKEIEIRDVAGNDKVMLLSKMPFLGRNDNEPAVVTVAVDNTNSREFEDRIRYVAMHDSLTGLPNRTMLFTEFHKIIHRTQSQNECLGLLFVDIDYFKNINDSLGHQVGDLLIQEVAIRMQSLFGSKEMIARLGGDEYIILIPGLPKDELQAENRIVEEGQKLLKQLAQPFEIDEQEFHITVSIGIVLYPRDGVNKDQLMQRADTAMYQAKNLGRNQIHVFTPALEQSVKKRHTIENELRTALQNEEFILDYQSVFESGRWAGCEALLRWNHPNRGVVGPHEFIELAEQKNFIVDIGHWVMKQACKNIRKWLDNGHRDFFISVNVSVNQIKDKQFFSRVKSLMDAYKIPDNYLEIEVTESLLMKEVQRSIHVLKKLRLIGVRTSIDDFGTGYSSFKYLMQLPLDKMKIDRLFVKDLPDDTNSLTIVKTILQMTRELGLDVVAEGVETKEQFEILKSNNCQYFQGYYLHKPSSLKQLEDLYLS